MADSIEKAMSAFETSIPKIQMLHIPLSHMPFLLMEVKTAVQVENAIGRYACALLNHKGAINGGIEDLTQSELEAASFVCTPDIEEKLYKVMKEAALNLRPKLVHEAVLVRLQALSDVPKAMLEVDLNFYAEGMDLPKDFVPKYFLIIDYSKTDCFLQEYLEAGAKIQLEGQEFPKECMSADCLDCESAVKKQWDIATGDTNDSAWFVPDGRWPLMCPACKTLITPSNSCRHIPDPPKQPSPIPSPTSEPETSALDYYRSPPPTPVGCILGEKRPFGPCICVIPKVTRCACGYNIEPVAEVRKLLTVGVLKDTARRTEDEPMYRFKGTAYVLDTQTRTPVALSEDAIRSLCLERPALRRSLSAYNAGERLPATARSAHIELCPCGSTSTFARMAELHGQGHGKKPPATSEELKAAKALHKKIAKHFVAFLNSAEGGMVDLGTRDELVEGFQCSVETEKNLRQVLDAIADKDITPKVMPDSYDVRFVLVATESSCCSNCPSSDPGPPPPHGCSPALMVMELRVKPSRRLFGYRGTRLYRWDNDTRTIETVAAEFRPEAYNKHQFSMADLAMVNSWASANKKSAMQRLARQLQCKVAELLFYLEQPLKKNWFRILPKAVDTPDP